MVSCNSGIREDAKDHMTVSCTYPGGGLGTVFEVISQKDSGFWDSSFSKILYHLFAVQWKEPTLALIFRFDFQRGGNYSCFLLDTVLILSIGSIIIDLFRHRFSPFDSLTLLRFRSCRFWSESFVS